MPVGPRAGRLRLPPLHWLAGVGPIAWRQLLLAMRTSRHMLIMTVVILAMGIAMVAFSGAGTIGQMVSASGPQATAGGAVDQNFLGFAVLADPTANSVSPVRLNLLTGWTF